MVVMLIMLNDNPINLANGTALKMAAEIQLRENK